MLESSPREDVIRVEDLAHPVLSDIQRQALAAAEAAPVVLTVEAVLDTARAQTGLEAFGAPDFRERLEQWVAAVVADTGLSAFGRAALWSEMVRFAATRLRVEDLLQRTPAISATAIETPLVVAGLPRSGTTYLLQVLAGDRRLRALPYWEAVRPVAAPFISNGVDTRYDLCAEEWRRTDALLPLAKTMHEFSPDHISEDIELQCIDFGSYYVEWLCEAPLWRDYYVSHDHTPVYRYMRRMLQVLSWQRGPNRWVTKCPQHMEQLLSVAAALPGSTLLVLHRDPVASIQSAITAVAYRARLTHRTVDLKRISDYWIDRYERLLRACVRDRDLLPPGQAHDVYFHRMMADPMGTLEQIYRCANLAFDDAAQADLQAAIASNSRSKHGKLVYDIRADLGLDPAAIRERFGFYFERFPASIEVT